MDDSDLFAAAHRQPTTRRPLLGLTILVIEDSRYACEAMRLLCLRSGARIRRADCLKSARRHLQVYRPSVLIVDLGLPDGSGLDLIEETVAASPRVSVVLGTSGDDTGQHATLKAGADGFLAKPVTSLATFQEAILSRLPADRQPMGPGELQDETIQPDRLAFQDDMAHVADVLNDSHEDKILNYVAQFLGGVARSVGDSSLAEAAAGLAQALSSGRPVTTEAARIAGLVQERLNQKLAI